MRIELEWPGGRTPVDLRDGPVSVGSGEGSDICLAGIPSDCLRLEVSGEGVVIRGSAPLRVGRSWLAAETPRLLLRGERVDLGQSAFLSRPPRDQPADRDVLRRLDTTELTRRLLGDAASVDGGRVAAGDLPLAGRAATLTCLSGGRLGVVFPLTRTETLLGRDAGVDVVLDEPSVSRHHARLVQHLHERPPSVVLHEVRSTNGLFVNGARVRGAVALATGDIVELGAVHLRFEAPLVDSTVVQLPVDAGAEPSARATLTLPSPRPPPPRAVQARGRALRRPGVRLARASADEATVLDLPQAGPAAAASAPRRARAGPDGGLTGARSQVRARGEARGEAPPEVPPEAPRELLPGHGPGDGEPRHRLQRLQRWMASLLARL